MLFKEKSINRVNNNLSNLHKDEAIHVFMKDIRIICLSMKKFIKQLVKETRFKSKKIIQKLLII